MKSILVEAQEKEQFAIDKTNQKINELGIHAGLLYNTVDELQALFDRIRNVPHENQLEYSRLKKIRMEWKEQAIEIENDFRQASAQAVTNGAAGVGLGLAVLSIGPSAAMGVATTFGIASTGTAISTLSGAAATNAALAWLGGGALAAGGGGIVAGEALLAMAGPIGFAIGGVALLSSGLTMIVNRNDHRKLEVIFTLICKRNTKSYELASVELSERITRIINENNLLREAIGKIKTFGLDYEKMTEAQQYELGSYVNLMEASTQLLVNPITGLLPKYTDSDYNRIIYKSRQNHDMFKYEPIRKAVISLANLFYKIDLDDKEKRLLIKALKKNESFLETINLRKKELNVSILDLVSVCLAEKYKSE